MAHKHENDWIPLAANGWGATHPVLHKDPTPRSRLGEGEPLTWKINNHLIDNSSN
jgi:hypothetical protein